ncbi:hypothetical protein CMT42_15475 [Elizabethkingia anophelis]|uniref:Uncharacterized protein n=1 Tax=Elizabethkingia anophelis TaxID=1117645 RepID=A0A494J1T8_9FLAO|nr:hypothetical protein AYC66_18365 [Elizabethkingia anophelis]MDV3474566.1 hypothetical protein [Elizabethkingia anophelis]MDV3551040.1 hypothetical protein [Elizabethkingia anophelis]MDV3570132.1 hypothetical protein [Elizabethkingia anophelis]MDV3593842.1 hypothetical protein [Elizabethkingia anophelis]
MWLNKDNIFRGHNWGKKGDKIKIISISGNAVIFENVKGDRLPCNINDISETEIKPDPIFKSKNKK